MIITKITLNQFRNYLDQEITTSPGINVFFGDNAQGKTNILEAVYLCTCARSHRTARDSDLILHDKDQYGVKIEFICQNGSTESVEIRFLDAVNGDAQRSRSLRQIYHNGLKLDRISDMMGLFHAVIFAPEDLMIVKEGPATRRRYLDLLISQIRPGYFVHLQQYNKIINQRNRLLKMLRDQGYGRGKNLDTTRLMQLDVWDDALTKEAVAVIKQRRIFTERIAEIAAKAQNDISSGKEQLNVKYKSVPGIDINTKDDQLAERLLRKLKSMLYDDIEKGSTQVGPHRDDLDLSLDGSSLKPFASQGQQRSAVLALKLAELIILREETGEAPVFLLDDVMSELDENRRNSLLENIHEAQVFVTCTDTEQIVKEFTYYENKSENNHSVDKHKWSFFKVVQGQVMPTSTYGEPHDKHCETG